MRWVCPTITAKNRESYQAQLVKISDFTKRVHIDLSDGTLSDNELISIDDIWMPHITHVDIHLMSRMPESYYDKLVKLKPHMVIFHAEADGDLVVLSAKLHAKGIKTGLALLPDTQVFQVRNMLPSFDAMLIFGGHLGYQGGVADLTQLHKVADEKSREAKEHQPHIEIMWDGGINDLNARTLVNAGVDVLNVGSYIHANDPPKAAFDALEVILYG